MTGQGFALCRNAQDGYYFEVDLVPDQKKVNFHHWVGMLVHRGTTLGIAACAPLLVEACLS